MNCTGYNKKGDLVDTRAKYLIIAKLCFSTSLIMAFFSIFALCYIAASIANGPADKGMKINLTLTYIVCAGSALFPNVVMIPLTIFSKYSLPCHKYSNDTDHVYHGVLHAQYQGFKTIWIVMLAVPCVLIITSVLYCLAQFSFYYLDD